MRLLLLLMFFSCSSFGIGRKVANLNIPVKKVVLPNGLTILVSENHRLPIFSYYTFYNVGGRHESAGTTGATHFLEHMMFKGTKKYGPGKFDTMINFSGGSNNAYTSFDNTVYYENVPSLLLEKIVDIEADRMESLLLEEKAFESERMVVFEERKLRYENKPSGKLYLKMMQAMFEGTPYGGSVIGSEKDLASLSRTQVREFFKNFYTPDNAIVVVVGDVNAATVISLIRQKYGQMKPSSDRIKKYKAQKNDPKLYAHQGKYGGRHLKIRGSSPNPLFYLSYKGLPYGVKESYTWDILAHILGSGASSILQQKYVYSKPMLTGISAYNYGLRYNGVFMISGELLPKYSLTKFRSNLIKTLRKSCNKITQT